MKYKSRPFLGAFCFSVFIYLLLIPHLYAGSVVINAPSSGADISGSVTLAASSQESQSYHIEVWDNGSKVANYFTGSVNAALQLPAGSHTTTVETVSNAGVVLDVSSVNYLVEGTPPGVVQITSPAAGSTTVSAVQINASAGAGAPYHLEIWDNGYKLGNVFSNTVSGVYVLPVGQHYLTVQSVTPDGHLLHRQTVAYQVAENCNAASGVQQCDMDELPVDNMQRNCDPPQEVNWVANGCGDGVQGASTSVPVSTVLEQVSETGTVPDQGNLTLNGHALHLRETQASAPSNVLFRSQSPTNISETTPDTHWTLDGYAYLPDPTAHQAFEMDAQYTVNNTWTKFASECAFNMNNGTGYWAVFDTSTGGWIFLNGQVQGGQTPPVVPCNRSQFAQPWSGSSNPGFTGWHHIVWNFQREADGTVTFQSLTFDGTTTQVNFHPNSQSGGTVQDSGHFGTLVQLDGVDNQDGVHSTVEAYVDEVSLTHTP